MVKLILNQQTVTVTVNIEKVEILWCIHTQVQVKVLHSKVKVQKYSYKNVLKVQKVKVLMQNSPCG